MLSVTLMALVEDFAACALIHSFIHCVFLLVSAVWIEMIRLENCKMLTYQYMMNYRKSKTNTKPV